MENILEFKKITKKPKVKKLKVKPKGEYYRLWEEIERLHYENVAQQKEINTLHKSIHLACVCINSHLDLITELRQMVKDGK